MRRPRRGGHVFSRPVLPGGQHVLQAHGGVLPVRAGLPVRPTLEPTASTLSHSPHSSPTNHAPCPTNRAAAPLAGRGIGASAVGPGSSGTGAARPTPAASCGASTFRSACQRSCPPISWSRLVRRSTRTSFPTPRAPRARGRSAAASTTRATAAARRGTRAPTAPRASRNARAHTDPTLHEFEAVERTTLSSGLHWAALWSVCPETLYRVLLS